MTRDFYLVRTTFLGSDSPSEFYFDTEEKAKKYLADQTNGEIEKVSVDCEKFNYSDGCTYNELTYYNCSIFSQED